MTNATMNHLKQSIYRCICERTAQRNQKNVKICLFYVFLSMCQWMWWYALMLHLWCTDDLLMMHWGVLKMHWWWANDVLMMHWWCADDALTIRWCCADGALMMHWWCTDDALMVHWWCTYGMLMMHWWCTNDILLMHKCHVWYPSFFSFSKI